jgi:predicted AAA+ superfamily ATPase
VLKRLLTPIVMRDLREKMVLLSGPRQSGKTTLALGLLGTRYKSHSERYLNWDDDAARTRILRREFPHTGMVVFDEVHKYTRWRNFVKGLFDAHRTQMQILVTGSARLDLYRRGGDSLQGRYHHLRLYPLSLREAGASVGDMLKLGPFPEPLLSGSETSARRWSMQYRSRLVREDVATLEHIKELGALEQLSVRLPDLVGSPLSLNALREDLDVAHKTVERWMDILERLMFTFRLLPFGPPRIKALRKSRKNYLLDWTPVSDPGARFENMIAFHLVKEVHFLQDVEGRNAELRFFRDIEGREVDFVQMLDGKPVRLIECKLAESSISPTLLYLGRKFPGVPSFQVVASKGIDRSAREGVRLVSAEKFLSELEI